MGWARFDKRGGGGFGIVFLYFSIIWQLQYHWKVLYALLYSLFSRAFVPAVLLGEAEPKVNDQSPKTPEQPSVSINILLSFMYCYISYFLEGTANKWVLYVVYIELFACCCFKFMHYLNTYRISLSPSLTHTNAPKLHFHLSTEMIIQHFCITHYFWKFPHFLNNRRYSTSESSFLLPKTNCHSPFPAVCQTWLDLDTFFLIRAICTRNT